MTELQGAEKPNDPNRSIKDFLYTIIFCFFCGAVVVALPVVTMLFLKMQGVLKSDILFYTISIICLLPFLQAQFAGYKAAILKFDLLYSSLAISIILLLDIAVASFFFGEGVICIVIAIPLLLLWMAIGQYLGIFMGRRAEDRNKLFASILPLIMLFIAHDISGASPVHSYAVSDAVTIHAPPEKVWRYIIDHPQNDAPPEYWLWKIGLPIPIQSVAEGKEVGAARECRFTKGIVFKERISEVQPNKVMTFDITEQPNHPEILGHFSLDKGQFYLEDNKDGTTTVIATSWYRLFVDPAAYFDWWAQDTVREVHFRVLNHIKRLSEEK